MYFYNVLCFDAAYSLSFSKLVKQSDKISDIGINLKVLNIYRMKNMTTVLWYKQNHKTRHYNQYTLGFYTEKNIIDTVKQRCAQLRVILQMPFPAFISICFLIISVVKCHKWYSVSVSKII